MCLTVYRFCSKFKYDFKTKNVQTLNYIKNLSENRLKSKQKKFCEKYIKYGVENNNNLIIYLPELSQLRNNQRRFK